MKVKQLILALSIIAGSASFAASQIKVEVKPGTQQPAILPAEPGENDVVDQVFSPITANLNLTPGQRFRIASIATATMLRSEPLFQQLDDLDAQLSTAAFTGKLDDSQIKELSQRQANLLSQIIVMKAQAKMSFYRILTTEQRTLVADQYRTHTAAGNLGSISN